MHENRPGAFQDNCMHYAEVSMLSVMSRLSLSHVEATYCLLGQPSPTLGYELQTLFLFPKMQEYIPS